MRLRGRMKAREEYARAVLEVARGRGPALSRAWAASHNLEGGDAIMRLCQLQADLIEGALERMLHAHSHVFQEVDEDQDARQLYDEARSTLLADLSSLKNKLIEDVGEACVGRLGLHEPIPRTPTALDRYTQELIERLGARDTEVSPRFGVEYNTSILAQRLAGTLIVWRRAVASSRRESRETHEAHQARDTAVAEFERALFNGCRVLEGLFRQAELYVEAERVRPSNARISGRLEEDPLPVS